MSHLPPLSLYVHIPWCVRKCPYCDFNSHEIRDGLPEKAYISALLNDLEHELDQVHQRPLTSIFFGGGTPGLFSADGIHNLLQAIEKKLIFDPTIEISLEVNPGATESEKFSEFRQAGINRLSIGVQSLDDRMLGRLGRIHDVRAAIHAAEMAHNAGFEQFNLDLMYGLPGQQRSAALHDLRQAIDLKPGHLSWYQLTLEPNTLFYQQPPSLPDNDQLWDMQVHGQELLASHGYQQYEISAYGHNHQCRHNLNYWQFGDYIGIGAGAHGKLSQPGMKVITRRQRCRHPADYMKQAKTRQVISQSRQLQTKDRLLESMMNILRLNTGISHQQFERHTGLSIKSIAAQLQQGIELGLLQAGEYIQATPRGRQYLNDLLQCFMD